MQVTIFCFEDFTRCLQGVSPRLPGCVFQRNQCRLPMQTRIQALDLCCGLSGITKPAFFMSCV